jgi:hypothetical protein
LSSGSFPGLEEAVAEVSFQGGLGLHWYGLFGKGRNRGLLIFCEDVFHDFYEESNHGWSGITPVDNRLVLSNIGLGFDKQGKFAWWPRDKQSTLRVPAQKEIALVSEKECWL